VFCQIRICEVLRALGILKMRYVGHPKMHYVDCECLQYKQISPQLETNVASRTSRLNGWHSCFLFRKPRVQNRTQTEATLIQDFCDFFSLPGKY
jgi:hypothetical protein